MHSSALHRILNLKLSIDVVYDDHITNVAIDLRATFDKCDPSQMNKIHSTTQATVQKPAHRIERLDLRVTYVTLPKTKTIVMPHQTKKKQKKKNTQSKCSIEFSFNLTFVNAVSSPIETESGSNCVCSKKENQNFVAP